MLSPPASTAPARLIVRRCSKPGALVSRRVASDRGLKKPVFVVAPSKSRRSAQSLWRSRRASARDRAEIKAGRTGAPPAFRNDLAADGRVDALGAMARAMASASRQLHVGKATAVSESRVMHHGSLAEAHPGAQSRAAAAHMFEEDKEERMWRGA